MGELEELPMFTPQPMDLIALFILMCLVLAVVEAVAPTPASKLVLQASLLLAVIGWVSNAFHLTGPLKQLLLSCLEACNRFDLIAWVMH